MMASWWLVAHSRWCRDVAKSYPLMAPISWAEADCSTTKPVPPYEQTCTAVRAQSRLGAEQHIVSREDPLPFLASSSASVVSHTLKHGKRRAPSWRTFQPRSNSCTRIRLVQCLESPRYETRSHLRRLLWSGEPPHNNSQHIISYGTFFSSSCLHLYGHEAKQSFHRRIFAHIEGLFLPQFVEDPFLEDDPTRTFARWCLFWLVSSVWNKQRHRAILWEIFLSFNWSSVTQKQTSFFDMIFFRSAPTDLLFLEN